MIIAETVNYWVILIYSHSVTANLFSTCIRRNYDKAFFNNLGSLKLSEFSCVQLKFLDRIVDDGQELDIDIYDLYFNALS